MASVYRFVFLVLKLWPWPVLTKACLHKARLLVGGEQW